MFFKKKEVAAVVKQEESRREDRYRAIAHIAITNFDGKALLRNINHGGFCIESRTHAALTSGERYSMTISPEFSSRIKPFILDVEVRWIKNSETNFKAGFKVLYTPADRAFEKYVDYVKAIARSHA
ncbi:MAG: PilZ domain-containing protein [Spirochaetaceae bacterium]|jgi:hypothetical protein|nr:PilZ domain-containing protein [Spirochaetaceae bacterium]